MILPKHKRPIWKEKTVVINIPYCPECGHQLKQVTDPDLLTMMNFMCRNCTYRH